MGNVVEVGRKSDRVMVFVLNRFASLGREVMRIMCTYGPLSRRPDTEKVCCYNEMASEWDKFL